MPRPVLKQTAAYGRPGFKPMDHHDSPFADQYGLENQDVLNGLSELRGATDYYERENETLFESQTPPLQLYREKVKEGVDKLHSTIFGFPFRSGTYEPERYWERVPDPTMLKWYHPAHAKMLRFRRPSGVTPSEAIQSIVDNQAHWTLDCAAYIQVVQLYALSKTNPVKFDQTFNNTDLLIRFHNSPGVERRFFFRKHCHNGPWHALYRKQGSWDWWPIQNTAKWNDATLLRTPIGSRLMWRNKRIAPPETRTGQEPFRRCSYDVGFAKDAYRNENTVKYGPNLFRAWPLSNGPISEERIRAEMARARMHQYPDPALTGITDHIEKRKQYANRNIFLCEVIMFKLPDWINP